MASTDTKRSSAKTWGLILLVLLLAVYLYVHNSHNVVPVRATSVTRDDLISTISTNGKVEPVRDFQAHAPSPGQITKLLVSVGQVVTQGQELLRMNTSDVTKQVASAQSAVEASRSTLANLDRGGNQDELLASKADLTTALAQQKQAADTLASLLALQAKGAASDNEVYTARQHLTDAKARIAQLKARSTGRYSTGDVSTVRAQLADAEAGLAAAENNYAAVDIHAPFAGTVYSLPVSQYDYINAGEALLDVADLKHLQVRAYFDEPEIGQLAVDQPVKIVWDAMPLRTWHGHIAQAPTTVITYGTRSVGECLITVDDADGDLLPNTNVTVTVTTQERKAVLSLPREALHTEGVSNYVFRIVDGRLLRTAVQVGVVNLTRVEITGGLNSGDSVILRAATEGIELTDGLRVVTVKQ